MRCFLFTHPACLEHVPGPGSYPERPERLQTVLDALAAPEFAHLERREAPRVTRAQLLAAHAPDHVDAIEAAAPSSGTVSLYRDTWMSPGSLEAARRAAGAGCAAVDAVLGEGPAHAFCAVRPPGHHAERARAMGFCLFGNAAIAALHARAAHGLSRVAVVDFDVHHGNGTQDIFDSLDEGLFFASIHESPLFPGTGAAEETGRRARLVNLPVGPGTDSARFRAAVTDRLLPELIAFAPELLVISAGFDAHHRDPLGSLGLGDADYEWLTRLLAAAAHDLCGNRLVSMLEGGYDLDALASASAAHMRALMRAPDSLEAVLEQPA